jgi:protein-disulfide isomerase
LKKTTRLAAILAFVLLAVATQAQQSTPPSANPGSSAPPQAQKNIEAYLRNLYAFGPDVQLSVGPFKGTAVEGILETNIDVVIEGNKQTVKFYASKDGRFLFQGELSDMSKDPLAETRAKIQMSDAPSVGDSNAPVTLVEYSDFQCPVCKSLHDVLRGILPNYAGKVRVVFKDFPLEQVHPWARTAAIAGRCAYQQDAKAFWKVYDLIYDNQEVISAANAWTKMADYAAQPQGIERACREDSAALRCGLCRARKKRDGEVYRQQSGAHLRRSRRFRAEQNASPDVRRVRRIALFPAGGSANGVRLQRRATGDHHLRRCVERQKLLGQSPL